MSHPEKHCISQTLAVLLTASYSTAVNGTLHFVHSNTYYGSKKRW